MRSSFLLAKALGAGAIAGAVVLGFLSRIATALLAMATGHPHNLSGRGIMEVAVLGTALGAVGGFALLLLKSRHCESTPISGLILGGLVFLGTSALSWASGRLDLTQTQPVVATLVVVAVFCFAYGVLAQVLFQRFLPHGRREEL